MKLKYRFLFPTLITVALLIMLFASVIIQAAFGAQFDGDKQKLIKRARLAAYAYRSAYTNYALQNIELSEDKLSELARAQGEDIRLERAGEPARERVWLDGRTLSAVCALELNGAWYALTVYADISDIYGLRAFLINCYYAAYIAAILIIGGVLLGVAWRVTKPLEELTRVSRELSSGNLETRARANDKGELGALAEAFNGMADALSDQLTRQASLIANLTHELKTPLTAIIGNADNIRSGKSGGEHALIAAQTIFKEGKRLDSLAGTLTEWILLKHETPDMRALSTMALITDALEAFDDTRVKLSPDARNAVIQGNHALMCALITNLIRNALNAGASEVIVDCKRADAYAVRITVSDDGCGIAAEALARITEPFYRADKARSRQNGGAGLGLTLCKRIAEAHNAQLRFESAPGEGTRAIIEMTGKDVETDE